MSVDGIITEIYYDCLYVDNGATNHVTFRQDLFKKFQPFVVHEEILYNPQVKIGLNLKSK